MGKSSNRDYIIPIKGLSIGSHNFSFSIDSLFFEEFENSEILSASLSVELVLEREVTWMKIDSEIKGEVGVECDRCLEELRLPVETDGDEIITLDPTESELDLKQFFYDYICLSIPLQKVHKKGDCNPDMIARLKSAGEKKNIGEPGSPFDKLKDLLN
ncbi:MAG: hypothetical protein WCX48_06755 [Bacteroidales bacterium]